MKSPFIQRLLRRRFALGSPGVLALSLLLLLQPGCDRAKASPPIALSTTAADEPMNHFWFNYRGQPDPGRRVWIRTHEEIWSELYPGGTVSRYKRSGRARVNGEMGTTVQKVEGDPKQTFTANDGSFEAFIPDRNTTNRILFFHLREQGKWGSWRALVPIIPID